ncbi:HET-domain-containing protein [Colletotrichum asianum]
MEQLAQSTKDAVRVTRKLGFRYLWVDAVCIVQDDDDDKLHELQAMRGIYQNATLTVVASHSQSALVGFATFDPPTGCQLPFVLPDGSMGNVTAVPTQIQFGHNITRPIDQRGWTFQERMLSKSLLIFDYGELKWRCATYPKMRERRKTADRTHPAENISIQGAPSEVSVTSSSATTSIAASIATESAFTFPLTPLAFDDQGLMLDQICAQRSFLSDKGDPEARRRLWKSFVGEYSQRMFTHNEDRLPAVAGLIEALEMTWNDKCIAGIWLSRLIEDLFWGRAPDFHMVDGDDFTDDGESDPHAQGRTDNKILGILRKFRPSKTRRWEWWEKEFGKTNKTEAREMRERSSRRWKRSELYLAPSWSWFSVSTPVSFHNIVPRASVISYDVEPLDQRVPLHNIKTASLRLQAKVLDAPSPTFIVAEIFDEVDAELPRREDRSYVRLGLEPQHEIADRWIDDADKRLSKSAMGLIVTRAEASGQCKRLGIFKPSHEFSAERPKLPDWVDFIGKEGPIVSSRTYDGRALYEEERRRAVDWENAPEREIIIV